MNTTNTATCTLIAALALAACAASAPRPAAPDRHDFSHVQRAFLDASADASALPDLIDALAEAGLCASAVSHAEAALLIPSHFDRALTVLTGPCKDIPPDPQALIRLHDSNPAPGQRADLYHYNMGRWLYHSGETAKAQHHFDAIAEANPLSPKAGYFRGVLALASKGPGAALPFFERVARQTADAPKQRRFFELATLATARILYEQRDLDDALARYETIPLDSEHRADVLFETFWVHRARGDLDSAMDSLAALRVLEAEGIFYPDALILHAQLLYQTGRTEEAARALQAFDARYARHKPALKDLLFGPPDARYETISDLLSQNTQPDMSGFPSIWLTAIRGSGAFRRHHTASKRLAVEIQAIKAPGHVLGPMAGLVLSQTQVVLARERLGAEAALDKALGRALEQLGALEPRAALLSLEVEKTRLMERRQHGAQ